MKKSYCNNCKGLRNHSDLFEKKIRDDDDGFPSIEKYLVIQCMGCENISFMKIYGDISMVDYDQEGNAEYYYDETIYPYYLEKGNELKSLYHLPPTIKIIYEETINAFKANSYILTAGGLRAIIEAICNHLKIKNDNLEKRIDALQNKGFITSNEAKRIHSIRFLGNDALHEIAKPQKQHLYILLEIVNHLLANLFINDKIIKGVVDTVIDKYEDFVILTKNIINLDLLNKELSMTELLGKSKRLVLKSKIAEFETAFIREIQEGKIEYISLIEVDEIMKFKVEKIPEKTLDW
ncbi:hypothetical protein ASF10_19255 [Flavobacterium sp. Leaf82]|uniref:DUF4145 domain-containing protein n=1 Tax=Flavobacterium sp. Leaf82 TaxID=1736238 RepID=UPI0006FB539C|nr:DUF4145 domain-containing protein [Flavobacterium sp. Leaf82]KQO33213.1 hypothetical protein ASF10_19255 [Flavobacterium sp. Leaf82]